MAICRGFLNAHGATIAAERHELRGGVLFRIGFPISDAPRPTREVEE